MRVKEMEFMKIFHVDTGRKYFSKEEIKEMIDWISENGFQYLELAIGNGGLRFLLDDMTIETATQSYSSKQVTEKIIEGNKVFCDCGVNYLSEAELEELVDYSEKKHIELIPLLNTPGHMDSIVYAMEALEIEEARFQNSKTTMNLEQKEAVAFTQKLVEKYSKWFAARGCRYFNLGCDEYANDVLTSGFEALCNSESGYEKFVSYVNQLAKMLEEYGMRAIMFNDGLYYKELITEEGFIKNIICSYWTNGWKGYEPASADFVYQRGHEIINTHSEWYYVLGRDKEQVFHFEAALKGIGEHKREAVIGAKGAKAMGAMLCFWCDEPEKAYDEKEKAKLRELICNF